MIEPSHAGSPASVLAAWERATGQALEGPLRSLFLGRHEVPALARIPQKFVVSAFAENSDLAVALPRARELWAQHRRLLDRNRLLLDNLDDRHFGEWKEDPTVPDVYARFESPAIEVGVCPACLAMESECFCG